MALEPNQNTRFDRGTIYATRFDQAEREDREFWWRHAPLKRLRHLEYFRELNYGPEAINQGLQRVLEVSERPKR